MRGQASPVVRLALGIFLVPLLVLPWLANAASGRKIKLPPLRMRAGEKAPGFALPATDGKTVRLSDFSGHIVLIDFYRGYW
jgi:cytochrome oxidase Cu insertion factor (SCO1/SenC/PrrC family)